MSLFKHHRYTELCREAADHNATVVVVTKYIDAPQLASLAQQGVIHVGENRVADACTKQDYVQAHCPPAHHPDHLPPTGPSTANRPAPTPDLPPHGSVPVAYSATVNTPYVWHFIGHLQRKKVAKTIGRFALIHSVDTTGLAEKLSDANADAELVQPILLQVNMAAEPQKHGYSPEDLAQQMAYLLALPNIRIDGLMAMAPHGADDNTLNTVFGNVANLRTQLEETHQHPLPHLSMGMSSDYPAALRHGATLLRIGSELFNLPE